MSGEFNFNSAYLVQVINKYTNITFFNPKAESNQEPEMEPWNSMRSIEVGTLPC